MIRDEQWPVARLIPISSASGVEAQERRAASALLAVISAVSEFGRSLLKPLGAPAGKVEAFIEVPFKLEGRSVRPDGIITVSRGGKTWGAIVEVKTGLNSLDPKQIDTYLDLARELDFDAVLSISNQYVTSSTEYPVEVDRRKSKRVSLRHWSWIDVLTEAVVQQEHRGVSDPDQAYILGELVRYLSDERSGAVSFEGMGSGWTSVRDAVRQHTLRKGDEAIGPVIARWDDLLRYLALDLTKELGRSVKQVLPTTERSPASRRQALRDSLVNSGRLYGTLQIPDAVSPLKVVADLRAHQIVVSSQLDAPKEGRSKGRVSWLLRQLASAASDLRVEARAGQWSSSLTTTLAAAREAPATLYPEGKREIREFALSLTRKMGTNRAGNRGSFAESVLTTSRDFYAGVLQYLRPWKAGPPKLRPTPPQVDEEADAAGLAQLEDTLDAAGGEGANLVDEQTLADESALARNGLSPVPDEPPGREPAP